MIFNTKQQFRQDSPGLFRYNSGQEKNLLTVRHDIMTTQEFITHSEDETFRLAEKIGRSLKGNEIIGLVGDLGAGKTVFTKGLASGLGLEDRGLVCSPSYTLINIYEAKVSIIHIDLYRIESPEEIEELGWEDYISTGVVIIEWADRMPPIEDSVHVAILVEDENMRKITIGYPPSIKLGC
jgi:tRNA threonylcarbamoyladenosine biosynthesis protein TsaE